jgi:hypothetical protein
MRYKFHPMNPNKKHTFSKPILFIDVAEHKQYKAGALKGKRQVKLSGNILKITLLSFEITGIHMHNMYKCVEK